MNRDFTIGKYAVLCRAIVEASHDVVSMSDYLAAGELKERLTILRHDVDRRPGNAMRLAKLEKSFGLRSTYYVRINDSVFSPSLVEGLEALGHEVGYHYETMAKCRGDAEQATAMFAEELATLRRYCTVETAAMHGSPASSYDNRRIWDYKEPQDFGLLGEAYLTPDYTKLVYLTDTGRSWDSRYNLRDRPEMACMLPVSVKSTDDLIDAYGRSLVNWACLQTHPERWAEGVGDWIAGVLIDASANQVKRAIGWYRARPAVA